MKTPPANAIQYATRPYTRVGFQIQSIEKGRVTLTRHVRHRGSILVLVVVLLVLLALMGTAYISTTRIDRASAEQNRASTQADLLVDGVKQMVMGQLVRDLTNGNATFALGYRNTTGATPYRPYDCSSSELAGDDLYLAERAPQLRSVNDLGAPTALNGTLHWASLSWPIAGNQFEDPYSAATMALTGWPVTAKNDFRFEISSYQDSRGVWQPALKLRRADTGAYLVGSAANAFTAADADGDGVADSGLWRIPGGEVDGVTYYAATRVVDLGSTINVNSAWSRGQDYAVSPAPLPPPAPTLAAFPAPRPDFAYFPSHIGLSEILGAGADFNNLVSFRFGGLASLNDANGYDDSLAHAMVGGFTFSSQGDALYHVLSRRLDNPGYRGDVSGVAPMVAFSRDDTLSLASRFCVVSPSLSSTPVETDLSTVLRPNTVRPSSYAANDLTNWYNSNFYYPAAVPADTATPPLPAGLSLRTILSTRNPVANAQPLADTTFVAGYVNNAWPPPNIDAIPSYAGHAAPKISINTAPFGELWRGFASVFADATNATTDNTAAELARVTDLRGNRMFRSTMREATAPGAERDIQFNQMRVLRSAMAAANAEAFRVDDALNLNPPAHSFGTTVRVVGAPTNPVPVTVTVFGTKPQPYISEIYACGETQLDPAGVGRNAGGYVAIEMYNPYAQPIDVSGWSLCYLDRGTLPGVRTVTAIGAIPAGTTAIPGGGYLLIENYDPTNVGASEAKYRPGTTRLPQTGAVPARLDLVVVPMATVGLGAGLLGTPNRELLIMRPSTTAALAPVDSFDFTGAGLNTTVAPNTSIWTYRRQHANPWQVIYPGVYNPTATPRQNGTIVTAWNAPALGNEPAVAGVTLGESNTAGGALPTVTGGFAIQLPGMAGPSFNLGANQFPFGGFARLVDLLQVPYVGAYTITSTDPLNIAPANVVEVNSLPMDSVFADDEDPADDANESVGRLCAGPQFSGTVDAGTTTTISAPSLRNLNANLFIPGAVNTLTNNGYEVRVTTAGLTEVRNVTAYNAATGTVTVANDFTNAPVAGDAFVLQVRYTGFASRLFDYFTALQNPNDDYLPAKPGLHTPPGTTDVPNTLAATAATANQHSEDSVPVQGLINVNTAPWRVLSMVPWVPASVPHSVYLNEQIAQAIVDDRQSHGPFRTLNDLLRVEAVRDPHSVDANGLDFSPTAVAIPSAVGWGKGYTSLAPDFTDRYIMINRVSNLLTTRSDGFIVYILVQGFRNAGTPSAYLESQRRTAFYVDRSSVTPANQAIQAIPIQTR